MVVGKTFRTFPAHAQPAILRNWQEAHVWIATEGWPGPIFIHMYAMYQPTREDLMHVTSSPIAPLDFVQL